MLPGLPCGLTVLLKDHYLRIDLVLRGKFDRGVVQEKLLDVPKGRDECWFIVLFLLVLGMFASTFCV